MMAKPQLLMSELSDEVIQQREAPGSRKIDV